MYNTKCIRKLHTSNTDKYNLMYVNEFAWVFVCTDLKKNEGFFSFILKLGK